MEAILSWLGVISVSVNCRSASLNAPEQFYIAEQFGIQLGAVIVSFTDDVE